ncbi:MAG: ribose 5-phosphate isomerase B [Deltaproteobacteria bacterium]|nr:ribose 5-phosphate isomerase B [Deltaproteobacteria bacterium]
MSQFFLKGPVAIGSDHAGRELKYEITQHLHHKGFEFIEFGVDPFATKVDYPSVANLVCEAIKDSKAGFGILVCGTGIGMAIAANRHPGIRAVDCTSEFMATLSRAHNDANVLTFGQRLIGPGLALSILDVFVATPFEGGRHQVRVDMLG